MFGRVFTTLFLISTLISVNSAFAQGNLPNPPVYVPSTRGFVPYPFNERLRPTPFQLAKEKWEKLSENETSCINNALRWENTSIKNLMQKGIAPTDPKLAKIRSNCQTQIEAAAESVPASDAETKKQIAELTDELRTAQAEIKRLRAETERWKGEAITRIRPQSQKERLDAVKSAAQNTSKNLIYTLIGVVSLILGILFLIGLFAPKEETKGISS